MPVDYHIPAYGDTQIPLKTAPMPNIDVAGNVSKGYSMAAANETNAAFVQESRDTTGDELLAKQYVDNGGNLITPDGLKKALTDLAPKLSLKGQQNLDKAYEQKQMMGDTLKANALKMNDLEWNHYNTLQDEAVKMYSTATNAYNDTLMATRNPIKAQEAFDAAKQAATQYASQLKTSDGKPLITPAMLQPFQAANYEQMGHLLINAKWYQDQLMARLKEGQVTSQIDLAKAKTTQADAQAKEALAKANAPATKGVSGSPFLYIQDPGNGNFIGYNKFTGRMEVVPVAGDVIGAKSEKNREKEQAAQGKVKEIVGLIDNVIPKLGEPFVTGAGGAIHRWGEFAGNTLGVSDATTANDVADTLKQIQLLFTKSDLAGGSSRFKKQYEMIDGIVRGLKPGDSPQITISALLNLRKNLLDASGLAKPEQPHYTTVRQVQDAYLAGKIQSRDEAVKLVKELTGAKQ